MQIRIAGPDDLDVVCEVRIDFLAEHRGVEPHAFPAGFAAETRNFVERQHAHGALHSWLAEDEDRCVGGVSLLLHAAPPRPEDERTWDGYLINMYVAPDARRQGIGRRLLDASLASAPELGIRRFVLHATPDGRPMYEGAGFHPNGDWLELRIPTDA